MSSRLCRARLSCCTKVAVLVSVLAFSTPLVAQQRQDAPVQGLTDTEVLDRLRQSGLTREQARARLTQLGYDPSLADPYFDRLEGRTTQGVQVQQPFVQALMAMGLLKGVRPGVST